MAVKVSLRLDPKSSAFINALRARFGFAPTSTSIAKIPILHNLSSQKDKLKKIEEGLATLASKQHPFDIALPYAYSCVNTHCNRDPALYRISYATQSDALKETGHQIILALGDVTGQNKSYTVGETYVALGSKVTWNRDKMTGFRIKGNYINLSRQPAGKSEANRIVQALQKEFPHGSEPVRADGFIMDDHSASGTWVGGAQFSFLGGKGEGQHNYE